MEEQINVNSWQPLVPRGPAVRGARVEFQRTHPARITKSGITLSSVWCNDNNVTTDSSVLIFFDEIRKLVAIRLLDKSEEDQNAFRVTRNRGGSKRGSTASAMTQAAVISSQAAVGKLLDFGYPQFISLSLSKNGDFWVIERK